jgi:hypothetical protein
MLKEPTTICLQLKLMPTFSCNQNNGCYYREKPKILVPTSDCMKIVVLVPTYAYVKRAHHYLFTVEDAAHLFLQSK